MFQRYRARDATGIIAAQVTHKEIEMAREQEQEQNPQQNPQQNPSQRPQANPKEDDVEQGTGTEREKSTEQPGKEQGDQQH